MMRWRGGLLAALLLAACGTDSGRPDSGAPGLPDGGGSADGLISAAPGQWTWVPFGDSRCADGTATGIGVNLAGPTARAIVFLEGGGACWDGFTCETLKTAVN